MKKIMMLIAMLYTISASAFFSNLIVFGDSLSDGGNFPESRDVFWNPSAQKVLTNYVSQLYVPFSNPVDTQVPGEWPVLNERYLFKQEKITGYDVRRKYRSISWSQFFLMDASPSKMMISPSELLKEKKIPDNFSFNYAWGYATSNKGCVNIKYQTIKSCDEKSIYAARSTYLKTHSDREYLKLQIPGVSKQVELFLNDVKQKKVVVNQNTLYAFWIAGNDLIMASNALVNNFNPIPAVRFILGSTAIHIIKTISFLLKSLPEEKRPKFIYVFNLFNPGLTPLFYNTPLGKIGNFSVKSFNFWLRWDVRIFNLFSKTKIVILSSYDVYQSASAENRFKNTMGKACQQYGGNYKNPRVIPKDNCDHYIFWNAIHPAVVMNQRIGNAFSALISDKTR